MTWFISNTSHACPYMLMLKFETVLLEKARYYSFFYDPKSLTTKAENVSLRSPAVSALPLLTVYSSIMKKTGPR